MGTLPKTSYLASVPRSRLMCAHINCRYYVLQGHEDLRQDERVMQLFGLVNNMLANDRITAERDLSIARYAVIPLSPNSGANSFTYSQKLWYADMETAVLMQRLAFHSLFNYGLPFSHIHQVIPFQSGLIGWVPNTDTLHALIREYRDARKIPLNVEHRLMLGMAPDYDHLTVIQKVEVFEHALDSTSGERHHPAVSISIIDCSQALRLGMGRVELMEYCLAQAVGEDLHKVLWLKSRNSEVWLDRRTHYTRSTAVMSMAGYILGLGDRHPSNLMLDRYSGDQVYPYPCLGNNHFIRKFTCS
jgi:FKBP12-rapamycin complex-associated protein